MAVTMKEIGTLLDIIDLSFVDPKFFKVSADRLPRTALFVLRYLDLSTQNAGIKKKIDEESFNLGT
jgi:hypothetical protein